MELASSGSSAAMISTRQEERSSFITVKFRTTCKSVEVGEESGGDLVRGERWEVGDEWWEGAGGMGEGGSAEGDARGRYRVW